MAFKEEILPVRYAMLGWVLVTLTELQSVELGTHASSQFMVAMTEAAGDRSYLITSPVGCFASAGAWPCQCHPARGFANS